MKSGKQTSKASPSSSLAVTSSKKLSGFERHDFPFKNRCCTLHIGRLSHILAQAPLSVSQGLLHRMHETYKPVSLNLRF